MSRLYEFMKMSTDDDVAKFRSMSFRLVKEATGHGALLDSVDEDSANQVRELQQELNAELKKRYNGCYKYDLCIDEGTTLDVLKIKRKQSKTLSIVCHQTNDKLSKIKRNVELKLSEKGDI